MDTEELVEIEERSHALVVTPRFHRLDAAVAPTFRDHVLPRLQGHRLVVVALGEVQSMDSSGLGALVAMLKLLPAGGVVRLAEVKGSIEKLLVRTRLNNILPVFPTVTLAVGNVFNEPGRPESVVSILPLMAAHG
jgi:anti-sigma B factor antagonist